MRGISPPGGETSYFILNVVDKALRTPKNVIH